MSTDTRGSAGDHRGADAGKGLSGPSPAVRLETSRIIDVSMAGSSTLRIARVDDGPEGPTLVLSHGFGGGDRPFTRPDYVGPPIRLPASILPELQAALEVLADEGAT